MEAPLTIELPAGPFKAHDLSTDEVSFPPSSLAMFHSLGMKDAFLNKGIIELRQPFTVCTVGKVLSPEQCRILVCFALPPFLHTSTFFNSPFCTEIVDHSIG